MSYLLTMIICSSLTTVCIPPFTFATPYNDLYSCMVAGYDESALKMKKLGQKEVNTHHIYIKFRCTEIIIPFKKPGVET